MITSMSTDVALSASSLVTAHPSYLLFPRRKILHVCHGQVSQRRCEQVPRYQALGSTRAHTALHPAGTPPCQPTSLTARTPTNMHAQQPPTPLEFTQRFLDRIAKNTKVGFLSACNPAHTRLTATLATRYAATTGTATPTKSLS